MRESIPYKIIGGVRFYERKEIKDSLAYLKLIINPHDDVSLRRVINVPARGVGKGVMDGAAGDRSRAAFDADAPPLLAAGLAEVIVGALAVGEADLRGRRGQAAGARGRVAARVPRPDHRASPQVAREEPVSIVARQDARSDRLPEGAPRREQRRSQRADREPDGAGVGGARLRGARRRGVARRLRRSAVAPVGSRRGIRHRATPASG